MNRFIFADNWRTIKWTKAILEEAGTEGFYGVLASIATKEDARLFIENYEDYLAPMVEGDDRTALSYAQGNIHFISHRFGDPAIGQQIRHVFENELRSYYAKEGE
jgi:hypothetical protein